MVKFIDGTGQNSQFCIHLYNAELKLNAEIDTLYK